MYGVPIVREPVSFGKLFGPRRRTVNPMGDAVFQRLQEEIAKEEAEEAAAEAEAQLLEATNPTEAPAEMDPLVLQKQILDLQTELEAERLKREEFYTFGCKLAQNLVDMYQLEEEEMLECIRLDIKMDVPQNFWGVQRVVWGHRTWENLEREFKKRNGLRLDDSGADGIDLPDFGKGWVGKRKEGGNIPGNTRTTVNYNVLSTQDHYAGRTQETEGTVVPRRPTTSQSPQVNPPADRSWNSGGNMPGPSRPTTSPSTSRPETSSQAYGRHSKLVKKESVTCIHKSSNFVRRNSSDICCIPELATRIAITSSELDLIKAEVEESSRECDRIMHCCSQINRMENLSVSVTRGLRSALVATRQATEMAVALAEVVEERDEFYRLMPTIGGGENMAGMEI